MHVLEILYENFEKLPDILLYLTLGLSAYIENLVPPFPGDTITAFGAFLVGTGKLNFVGVYISTTLGSLFGFLTLFRIGQYFGKRFFIEKKYRFLNAQSIIKAEAWIGKYGYLLIGFNRFMPGIRSAIAVAGGIAGLRFPFVAILALASCVLWNGIWIGVGYSLGNNWDYVSEKISVIMLRYNITILILFILLIIGVLIYRKLRTG